MTAKEANQMVKDIGYPFAYRVFPTDDPDNPPPDPPFIVYYFTRNNDMFADNTNYQAIMRLNIELYTDQKDHNTEALIRATLTEHGLTYAHEEVYLDDEHLLMNSYETEVLING